MNTHLTKQLQKLPSTPGIYKYFNADNEIIYVGKAVNLKNRVKSYFTDKDIAPRTKILVSQIDRLEYIAVQSEMDALILEANLIKEHRPRFNVILKDDKTHLYIKITLHEDWPRISTCRATDVHLDPKATYFGPFPSGRIVKDTLRSLRRVFPYLAHNQPPVAGRRRPPQSYFYYNLSLINQTDEPDQKEYRRQIFQLVYFLEGKRMTVVNELEKNMHQAAKQLDFEQAASIKRQLDGMAYVTQKTISPESYVSNPELMSDKRLQGMRELAQVLSTYWSKLDPTGQGEGEEISIPALSRIECFDISNISGQYAVGSMVVFIDGEASKRDYRKFKIKREHAPNDVAMMEEVLRRRIKRLVNANDTNQESKEQADTSASKHDSKNDRSFSAMPDLLMVDGGKGQLMAASQVLLETGLPIPVVGMTKREEELIVVNPQQSNRLSTENKTQKANTILTEELTTNSSVVKPKRSSAHGSIARSEAEAATRIVSETNFNTIRLARGSEALFLVQRLRDEAHRFAITYHRKLRAKGFIPG